MSDLMLEGVLRMPIEMAMETELSRAQFYDRAQQAMDTIERLKAVLEDVLFDLHPADRAEIREALKEDDQSDFVEVDELIKATGLNITDDDRIWAIREINQKLSDKIEQLQAENERLRVDQGQYEEELERLRAALKEQDDE